MSPQTAAGPVAFLAPMRIELRPLLALLTLREHRIGDLLVHTGRLGGREVLATMTGIGVAAATQVTEALLAATPIGHVVVVGVAGGVEPGLEIGDVVVPETVIAAWSGEEFQPTTVGSATPRGRLLTTERLETGPAVLATRLEQKVIAVDMETAAVAAVCERAGVAWSVFRSIGDRLSDNLVQAPLLDMVKSDGTPRAGATARYIATHPSMIGPMRRMSRDARIATDAAARAAIAACARPEGWQGAEIDPPA